MFFVIKISLFMFHSLFVFSIVFILVFWLFLLFSFDCLPSMVNELVFPTDSSTASVLDPHPKHSEAALQMYRGTFLIIFDLFLLGVNTYGWRSSGVNHVLIFEIDPRNHLSHGQLLEVRDFNKFSPLAKSTGFNTEYCKPFSL